MATATEKAEIQEAVDKDGRILKVAKDIIDEKKAHKNTNAAWAIQNNTYDFDELEKSLEERVLCTLGG